MSETRLNSNEFVYKLQGFPLENILQTTKLIKTQ